MEISGLSRGCYGRPTTSCDSGSPRLSPPPNGRPATRLAPERSAAEIATSIGSLPSTTKGVLVTRIGPWTRRCSSPEKNPTGVLCAVPQTPNRPAEVAFDRQLPAPAPTIAPRQSVVTLPSAILGSSTD